MSRAVFVLVYPSRLFAAHWALWIPEVNINGEEQHTGDRIHVTGDRLNGFTYEYDCDYNILDDDRHPKAFPIGMISIEHVSNHDRACTADTLGSHPFNDLDAACKRVPAPGPSLRKVAPLNRDTKNRERPAKAEVKDCQWWIEKVVTYLVCEGFLLASDAEGHAATIYAKVKELPRH
jgi:hypothetical protein